MDPTVLRPPGVESFLPISALISLKYWLVSGVFNHIHPAALVILIIILFTGIFLKKGFCSWVCPFSLISEYLEIFHKFVFRKNLKMPRILDGILRSIKYLLLLFFLWVIFVQMNGESLEQFIYSPYNRIADIKMMQFFTNMSNTTMWVLGILTVLSFFIPYFWCRYLCPYGALIGSLSVFSVFKINRNVESCIDCGKCAKVCPSLLKVDIEITVESDECHACMKCVDSCPVEDTLYFSASKKKYKMKGLTYGISIILMFIVGMTIARGFGYWQTAITIDEYKLHMQNMEVVPDL